MQTVHKSNDLFEQTLIAAITVENRILEGQCLGLSLYF